MHAKAGLIPQGSFRKSLPNHLEKQFLTQKGGGLAILGRYRYCPIDTDSEFISPERIPFTTQGWIELINLDSGCTEIVLDIVRNI